MDTSALEKLFQREMTRREFLAFAGLFVISIFGISSFLKNIRTFTGTQPVSHGFGSGPYGGIGDGKRGRK